MHILSWTEITALWEIVYFGIECTGAHVIHAFDIGWNGVQLVLVYVVYRTKH